MDEKKKFIRDFVVQFCATWCANNYDRCCDRDQHEALENPPVEDAEELAEKLWEKKGTYFEIE